MGERMKAGLKAGIICGILCLAVQLISLAGVASAIIGVVWWIFYFLPGILAVHYGKNVIKRGKDVFVSSAVAGVVYSLFLILILILAFSTFLDGWIFEDDLFLIAFATGILVLPIIIILSLIGGLLYAKYKLGIQLTGKKTAPPKVRPKPVRTLYCPRCRNKIEKSWALCPYCGTDLKGETRVYDDETRIY